MEALNQELPDDEIPEPAWKPSTLAGLDWCLRRLAEIDAEREEAQRIAEVEIAHIRMRLSSIEDKCTRGDAYFRERAAEYVATHRDELLKGGKAKSRKLLHGSVGWRKFGGGLTVFDEAALLTWCQAQPVEAGVLRIKETPVIPEVKKLFKASGEIPPGCDVEPEGEELFLKPALSAEADHGE